MGWGIERQLKTNSSEFDLTCNTYKLLENVVIPNLTYFILFKKS